MPGGCQRRDGITELRVMADGKGEDMGGLELGCSGGGDRWLPCVDGKSRDCGVSVGVSVGRGLVAMYGIDDRAESLVVQ